MRSLGTAFEREREREREREVARNEVKKENGTKGQTSRKKEMKVSRVV
jgi:hypothetical protein